MNVDREVGPNIPAFISSPARGLLMHWNLLNVNYKRIKKMVDRTSLAIEE